MKRLATKYVIIAEILYKRSFNGILLRCLHVEEIETTLEKWGHMWSSFQWEINLWQVN